MAQQLVHSGYISYNEQTNSRDITENCGYASLLFKLVLLNRLWNNYGV